MDDAPRGRLRLRDHMPAVAFLRASHLFGALPEEQFGRLVDSAELVDYAPAAIVLSEGSTDDYLFGVFDGAVAIRKKHGTELVELAVLDRGAVFGEIAVLTQKPRTASVVTTMDARLMRFSGDVVRSIADAVPKFGRLLATLVAGRVRDTEKKLGQ